MYFECGDFLSEIGTQTQYPLIDESYFILLVLSKSILTLVPFENNNKIKLCFILIIITP